MNKTEFQQLIAEGRIEEAIPALLSSTKNTRLHQEVVLLSARYKEYKRMQRNGLEAPAELERRLNQITHSLLELVDELPESSIPTAAFTDTGAGSGTGTVPPVITGTGDGRTGPVFSGTGDGGLRQEQLKMAFWFSVAAFAILLAITLFVPDWAEKNHILFKTLLALAAGGVAATLPGFLQLDWNNMLKAGGALAAFALVYFLNPAPAEKQEPFTLTVSVRTEKPSDDYPALKNAELRLWNRTKWDPVTISDEGVADFKNLSPELRGTKARVQLVAEFYQLAEDSVLISPPAVELIVQPNDKLERVFGKVSDPYGKPLAAVIVDVDGWRDTTDAKGSYELRIPARQQKDHYSITAAKARYKLYTGEVWPASGAMNFSLSKMYK